MAKGNKQDLSRSVLKLSYEAFQRGDSVQARQLAQAVLAGKAGKDDEKAAVELSDLLRADGHEVAPTPAAVGCYPPCGEGYTCSPGDNLDNLGCVDVNECVTSAHDCIAGIAVASARRSLVGPVAC